MECGEASCGRKFRDVPSLIAHAQQRGHPSAWRQCHECGRGHKEAIGDGARP